MEKVFFVIKKIDDINICEGDLPQNIITYCKNKKNYLTSLFSYRLLMELLSKFNIDIQSLSFSKNGKPLIEGGYVSLSHSNDYAIVSYSKVNHGIDLQYHNQLVDKNRIMKKYFKEYYQEFLSLNEKVKDEFFFKLWTIKECVVKKDDSNVLSKIALDDIYTFSTILELENEKYTMSFALDFPFEIEEMHF